jgi:hypothetical protein
VLVALRWTDDPIDRGPPGETIGVVVNPDGGTLD